MSEIPQSFHDHGFLGQGIHAHGTRQNYQAGCRCTPCRAAESCYQAMRQQARARGEGDPRGWVDAGPCRAHIATLKAEGVGLRQVAHLAGIAFSTVQAIKRGQARVTPVTEAAILQVKAQPADGVIVKGYRAYDRIRILLKEGYTCEQLRGFLGFDVRRRYDGITVRKAREVRKWYRRLTAE